VPEPSSDDVRELAEGADGRVAARPLDEPASRLDLRADRAGGNLQTSKAERGLRRLSELGGGVLPVPLDIGNVAEHDEPVGAAASC
jgi:hypothetical protein